MGLGKAFFLVQHIGARVKAVKIHDLLDALGPMVLKCLGSWVTPWVDYKLHDTSDTVRLRTEALVENGARIITVHASGGVPMMQAAVAAAGDRAEIYAITLLTSLTNDDIMRIFGMGWTGSADLLREKVVHELALMAKEAGVRTVVCSAQEVGMLKQSPDLDGMKFAVPGTRSAGVALGQQKRSGTPRQASDDGADFLVAGSQVTKAPDPVKAFDAFEAEIE